MTLRAFGNAVARCLRGAPFRVVGQAADVLDAVQKARGGTSAVAAINLRSELLTWGAGNLSAFWAFARGCDRVMHLQFRAGELGVSLVQVRAKRFEDSRSMRRTEWGQGDTKLLFRGFEISGIF